MVEALAIPMSEKSHRVMPTQSDFIKRFGKHYMAMNPNKNPSFVNMTFSSIGHGVRCHIKPLGLVIGYYYHVIMNSVLHVIAYYYEVTWRFLSHFS